MKDLVQTEEEHGLEARLGAAARRVEQPGEQVAQGREAANHPGRELPCKGALASVVQRPEMFRNGCGEGPPGVQHVVDDGARDRPGPGRATGRFGLRRGIRVHASQGLPGLAPSRCPGARRWPFRNSRANIGFRPGR